jgi:hypothetical protein
MITMRAADPPLRGRPLEIAITRRRRRMTCKASERPPAKVGEPFRSKASSVPFTGGGVPSLEVPKNFGV